MKSLTEIFITGLFAYLFLCSFSVQAQTMRYDNIQNNSYLNDSKPRLSASLSTSFTSYGSGINSFGTTFVPEITFPISNKFSISTGIGYSTFFIGNGNESLFQSNQSNYGHVFVSGNYLVNEKIIVRGSVYKTFILNPPHTNTEVTSSYYDFSSQGIIMDVEYKVTDNFRINIGFEYRQQNYPMYGPGMNPLAPQMNNFSAFPGFNPSNNLHPF